MRIAQLNLVKVGRLTNINARIILKAAHSDICEPSDIILKAGESYFAILISIFSKLTAVYPLELKSKVSVLNV